MTRRTTDREFSFIVRPADIGAEAAIYALEATAEERAALAARFDLVDLEAFRADLRVEWLRGHRFLRLTGHIRAEVTQRCVVTLQPVQNVVDERFEILFTPEAWPEDGVTVDLDDVEPLTGDELDIGEVAAEELALMLDPYPRAPGASLEQARFGAPGTGGSKASETGAGGGNRPFEVLAGLKRNK